MVIKGTMRGCRANKVDRWSVTTCPPCGMVVVVTYVVEVTTTTTAWDYSNCIAQNHLATSNRLEHCLESKFESFQQTSTWTQFGSFNLLMVSNFDSSSPII